MNEDERLILKNLALLYVEDNKRLISEINQTFDMIFSNVYTAYDGIEALEILDNHKVDIIITDLNMPNMNGIEFIKEVRQKDKMISIIVLTAHADKDLLLEASNLQIDGYLTKPMNFNKIFQALSNALQRIPTSSYYVLENGATYNTSAKIIKKDNEFIKLGKKESKLLDLLILNSSKITTKEEIIYNIWDLDDVTDSALKNLLSNLRSKIGKENILNYHNHGWEIKLKKSV